MGHTTLDTHNLLSRRTLFERSPLTSAHKEMDEMLNRISEQATDPFTISAFILGQSTCRLFDMISSSFFPSILASSNPWTYRVATGIHKTLRIASEAAGFEVGQRSMRVAFQYTDSSLLSWKGENGLRQGILCSTLNFFTLHGFGKAAAQTNTILRHTLQSLGVVSANQFAGLLKLMPTPDRTFTSQLLEAGIFNVQQEGIAQFASANFKHPSVVFLLETNTSNYASNSTQQKNIPFSKNPLSFYFCEEGTTSIDSLYQQSKHAYERGLESSRKGLDLYLTHLNVRLATNPRQPFQIDGNLWEELSTHFGTTRTSAETIAAIESQTERQLFESSGEDPNSPAIEKLRKIRVQREDLTMQSIAWEEIFRPSLETPSLGERDYLKVQEALEKYFRQDLGFNLPELLAFPKSQRDLPTPPTLTELPPALSTKIELLTRGIHSEQRTASYLMGSAIEKYIRMINSWLDTNPRQPFKLCDDSTWDLVADARSTLEFLQARKIEVERLNFEFRRVGTDIPNWYREYSARFNLALRIQRTSLTKIEEELLPVLHEEQLSLDAYQRIRKILKNFGENGEWTLPFLRDYPG